MVEGEALFGFAAGKHPAVIKEELVHAYPEGQTSYRSTQEV